MAFTRLGGVAPAPLAIWHGSLGGLAAEVQRDTAREVERLGFGGFVFGEALGREVFAQAAIYLAATERLVVASGIANIWARDASAMANGGRALAEAWPDRFILGIGVSHAPMVNQRGHTYDRPLTAMREYLAAMDGARWTGPDGAPRPPVVLAALGPKMVGLAAERTAGAYPYFTTDDHVREVRGGLGAEPFLMADLPVILAPDRAAARAIGRSHMERYLGAANYRNNLLRIGWSEGDLEPPGSDALFDAIVAWGGVDEVGRRIEARFAAGADQVVLNIVTADQGRPFTDELRTLGPLARR